MVSDLTPTLADSANIAFSTKATVWCTKPFLDWLPWSWLPKGSHLISSCTDKSNIPATFMMFSWVRLKFSQHSSYTASLKKRITDTYTGRCENIWLILKRDRKCQCHIWTSCWWRFAHFELAPDSTITNTTSYESLDVTAHPLFQIVNWTSPFTIVCYKWQQIFKS
jgi:hypothetical protein